MAKKKSQEEMERIQNALPLRRDDAGLEARKAEGKRGRYYGDCVTRAISSATGIDYASVRIALIDEQEAFAKSPRVSGSSAEKCAKWAAKAKGDNTFNGVHERVYSTLLVSLGWEYFPTPTHRTDMDEPCIPPTAIIDQPSHLVAKVDGTLVDTWDSRYIQVGGFWYDPAVYEIDYEGATWTRKDGK